MVRFALVVLIAVAPTVAAQRVDSIPLSKVPLGSEIRIWTDEGQVTRRRLFYDGTLPDGTERIEALRGRTASGPYFLKSALFGAAIGTFIGSALGACLDEGIGNTNDARPLGLFVFGTLGFGTGTFAGARAGANGRPVWAPVILPP